MNYCPNAQCAYAQRHGEAAEYRDEAQVCSDCGATLVGTSPARAEALGDSRTSAKVWGRVALTCIVPPLAVWLCPMVPLPGVDQAQLAGKFPQLAGSGRISAFTLGLSPVLSAFILVEIVALCVPRWRALRHGGPAARGRLLSATWKLALAVGVVQAFGVALYLEGMRLLAADTRVSRLLVVLSLVTGTCSFVLLARWLDEAGLGGGFSVLALSVYLRPLTLTGLEAAFRRMLAEPGDALPALVAAALTCGATVLLLRVRGPASRYGVAPIRLPACGIVPLQHATFFLALVTAGASLGLWSRATGSFTSGLGFQALAVRMVLIAVLAIMWSILFNRPANVMTLAARTAETTGAEARRQIQDSLRRAIAWSVAYVLVLGLVDWFVARCDPAATLCALIWAMLAAIVLDVVQEAQARSRLGELEAVWPEHRLYALDTALATLAQAGIPAFARSANHRALWHFFAPFIPVEILVPPARAEEASALLHERLAS
jgi:preprotein translocase subunit SecY